MAWFKISFSPAAEFVSAWAQILTPSVAVTPTEIEQMCLAEHMSDQTVDIRWLDAFMRVKAFTHGALARHHWHFEKPDTDGAFVTVRITPMSLRYENPDSPFRVIVRYGEEAGSEIGEVTSRAYLEVESKPVMTIPRVLVRLTKILDERSRWQITSTDDREPEYSDYRKLVPICRMDVLKDILDDELRHFASRAQLITALRALARDTEISVPEDVRGRILEY